VTWWATTISSTLVRKLSRITVEDDQITVSGERPVVKADVVRMWTDRTSWSYRLGTGKRLFYIQEKGQLVERVIGGATPEGIDQMRRLGWPVDEL
jgi:hypothetical protein